MSKLDDALKAREAGRCPFCGARSYACGTDDEEPIWAVECSSSACGAIGADHDTMEAAITDWNKPEDLVARMREMIELLFGHLQLENRTHNLHIPDVNGDTNYEKMWRLLGETTRQETERSKT